ncbi:SGNH/GDSL hydrolase family protein [Microbacterium sp. SD291]|uniref:SGNH/GDSL hydrolase family protein n=1 Tax=Microbacterium sp. SD291 TaxID=2782007 RepID=UPI001A9787AB|nr:SGNH/GDSL hydrolase family protein [Microbacterium sp. SD291]MBO0980905.1 SGNH/GDSL hydrolase family protein [Microbacterium sp. SD291]
MKRRLISVLAALTLGAAALGGAAPAIAADDPGGAPYVALGDSQAAGTGNLPYADLECLRSKKAYPSLLAAMSWMPVASSACAGATTDLVVSEQLGDLGPATTLVTLTAGINNVGWQDALAACSSGGSPALCSAALAAAQGAITGIPVSIGQTVGAIRSLAPNALIVVTGYPLLFGAVADSCSVGHSLKFSALQAAMINAGMAGVNTAVLTGVEGYVGLTGDPGVRFVDIAQGFAGHGLCDTGDRWISGLVSGAPTMDRAFHPNAAGQQAYATIIAGALAP